MIMDNFFENTVTNELFVVYGLIALVLVLIIIILFLDKRERQKKKDLFNNIFINTVKMKPVESKKQNDKKNKEFDVIESRKPIIKSEKNSDINKTQSELVVTNNKENTINKTAKDTLKELDDILANTGVIDVRDVNRVDTFIRNNNNLDQTKISNNKDIKDDLQKTNLDIKLELDDILEDSKVKINDIKNENTINTNKIQINPNDSGVQVVTVSELTQELAIKTELLKNNNGVLKSEASFNKSKERIERKSKIDKEKLDEVKEEELSKTQAQISVEALHKELEKALEMERNNIDHLEQLEEDEAIISYDQLVKVSDKIYEENDTSEYLDENDYPITIDELRKKFQQEMTEVKNENDEITKVQLQEFVDKKEIEKLADAHSRDSLFRTTPIISPVYGIQEDSAELLTDDSDDLDDISSETASELLNRLKEFTSKN